MAPCSRWGWFLVVALVLLLTLVPSAEGHRSKKRPQQPPQAPAPVPAPSIVPVPPPVLPPPAPVPPPSPAPPPTPPTKPSTTPPTKPTAAPTTKPLPRPAPVAPAPKPKPSPPASKPQPVPPKPKPDFTDEEINNGTALAKLNLRALKNARTMNTPQTHLGDNNPCQGANVPMRREWRSLPPPERKAFIAAVQCIMRQPVLSDPKRVPMAKSLYDDFVAVHYTSFKNTHLTASFFAWHRYYLASFEQRLRSQCGYKGALPYWEWGLDINNPAASPVFDGSETSLGSDGEFIPHDGLQLRQPFTKNLITLKPGSGGGCVKAGPFKDMRVHIGPAALAQYGTDKPFNVSNPLEDLPRCLKRDLNKDVATRFNSFRNTTLLILQQTTIKNFSSLLQGDDRFFPNTLGVHGGGHLIIGGDPGADAFIAPGDPAFWLHQAQVDRVYWIWQNLNFRNRQDVFGTMTLQDNPKSPNGSVEDAIDLTPINSPVKIKNLMNTASGAPLCYMYQ
ncbi:Putative tyrosinase copper-binding domain, di-copper centre-containing domain superfamily [Colletotrichum destructivum]|uniref:Tyrosinase copper-binding domain, di-copper centre-containing domain superfamily n=1 Tax=Colletotrichum destructivum TaxID=34406 RepID=A0AAX4I0H5_9PEZI|nr:Putative tyrosinase copper-binding domain, di-copper centre-containing domain superfamily [Colletotrichum destructivum]